MAPTRKRSRRPVSMRKHKRKHTRRHRGGEEQTPYELLQRFALIRAALEEKQNEDDLFDRMKKDFYKDNIPKMKSADWHKLVTDTSAQPGMDSPPSPAEIKKRIGNIHNVLRFWIQKRRTKEERGAFGVKHFFTPGARHEKLQDAVKEFMEFYRFLQGYSQRNEVSATNKGYYKVLLEEEKNILEMLGQSPNVLSNNSLAYRHSAMLPY